MNYDKIIFRIIRLDKSIYLELLNEANILQKSIAVWISTYILGLLGLLSFIDRALDYLKIILPTISQELIQSGSAIEEVELAIDQLSRLAEESLVYNIFPDAFIGLVVFAVQVGIVYSILKYLLRKDTYLKSIIVVLGFSTVPALFNFIILFTPSIYLNAIIIFITNLAILFTMGSGLKQVYSLRNIETILLVVASTSLSSILASI